MKMYSYSFDGEALGGQIVVVAKNKEKADVLAQNAYADRYPSRANEAEQDLSFLSESKFNSKGQVVYFDDGDY